MGRKKKSTHASTNKRGPRGWATNAQEVYLKSLVPTYVAAQSSKALTDFWALLWDGWFEQWELSPVTEEDEKKGITPASQLKNVKAVSSSLCY